MARGRGALAAWSIEEPAFSPMPSPEILPLGKSGRIFPDGLYGGIVVLYGRGVIRKQQVQFPQVPPAPDRACALSLET